MTSLEWLNTMGLSGVSDETKNAFLELASCIDTSLFCQDSAYVQALYAAHLYTLTATKFNKYGGGPITSIKEGGLSISYASSMQGSGFYSRTPYGVTLQGLQKENYISMDVII